MRKNEKMVHLWKLINEHTWCDDCLADEVGFPKRQAVNTICNAYFAADLIIREKGECPLCHSYKTLNQLIR